MTGYIPYELYNRIDYPTTGTALTTLDSVVSEIVYKLPGVPDLIVRKELWHTICDFCGRTGALLEKVTGDTDIPINPTLGEFLYVVGCFDNNGAKCDMLPWKGELHQVSEGVYCPALNPPGSGYSAVYAVKPRMADDTSTNGVWTPKVPQYLLTRYTELFTHGTLMRLFAMGHEPWANVDMARMHAVAYNNELNRVSFGLITSGMRRHLLIDVEDFIIQNPAANGNR